MPSLKLEDFSDRELLWALEEHADPDGYVSAQHLAEALGVTGLKNLTMSVAIRLGWLRRYGIVQRDELAPASGPSRWGLTDAGAAIMHAQLSRSELDLLENLPPEKLLAVTQRVGRVMTTAGAEAATMAGRDWRNAIATRKRARG